MISAARVNVVPRAYVDASVFGGIHDVEFSEASQAFFDQARAGHFALMISALVAEELDPAPEGVRRHFESWLADLEFVPIDERMVALQQAYLDAGIVTPKWADDALHVAAASVAGADLIVSWNFRHIVHFDKVRRYNAVNRLYGWPEIAIHSPSEVLRYEDEDI